jgi:hypothetical protein
VGTVEELGLKGFRNFMADYLEESAVGASVRNLVYDFLGGRRGRVGEELFVPTYLRSRVFNLPLIYYLGKCYQVLRQFVSLMPLLDQPNII